MDNLNELKALWQSANTEDLPDAGQIKEKVKMYRNQTIRKKIFVIIFSLLLLAFYILFMFKYKSNLISTYLGELAIIAAYASLASTNLRSIGRFYRLQDCSNKQFIDFLRQTRRNQIRFYKKTQPASLLCGSVGLFLFLYELVYKNLILTIITYSALTIYLLLVWLIIRPRVYCKQAAKINAQLEALEKIANQL